MNTKLLLCFAYLAPMFLGAGEDEGDKEQTHLTHTVWFSSTEDEGKDESVLAFIEEDENNLASNEDESEDESVMACLEDEHNSLASNDDEDKDGETLASVEEQNPESIV